VKTQDEPPRSSRVEREILEILEQSEAQQTPIVSIQEAARRRRATVQARVAQTPTRDWRQIFFASDIARFVGAFALAIVAAALSGVSGLLSSLLAIVAVLVFFSLWIPSRPSGIGGSGPRWRGQELGDNGPPDWFNRSGRGPKLPKR
jgi:hypothetical protein